MRSMCVCVLSGCVTAGQGAHAQTQGRACWAHTWGRRLSVRLRDGQALAGAGGPSTPGARALDSLGEQPAHIWPSNVWGHSRPGPRAEKGIGAGGLGETTPSLEGIGHPLLVMEQLAEAW